MPKLNAEYDNQICMRIHNDSNEKLKKILSHNSDLSITTLLRETITQTIEEKYQEMMDSNKDLKLQTLLEGIISNHEALSLDNAEDRDTLVKALVKGLTPVDYCEVQEIAQALFPTGDVEESYVDGELSIYTGLYNVAEGGAEEALLVDLSTKHIYEKADSEDGEEETEEGVEWF